jgi:hypothetical protein
MAAKVTLQDITDAGFKAAQFGTPADWATETNGYLARLIKRAELWAQGKFGTAAYDAVAENTTTHERLRSAELCWCSAHLWKRRAGFIDSNAVSSMEGLAYLDRREFEAQATRAFECADENMALAIGGEDVVTGSGVALVGVESGPYALGAT